MPFSAEPIHVNLAGSFAYSNKRTLLIDCDLRKPKIHTVMAVDKNQGWQIIYLIQQN